MAEGAFRMRIMKSVLAALASVALLSVAAPAPVAIAAIGDSAEERAAAQALAVRIRIAIAAQGANATQEEVLTAIYNATTGADVPTIADALELQLADCRRWQTATPRDPADPNAAVCQAGSAQLLALNEANQSAQLALAGVSATGGVPANGGGGFAIGGIGAPGGGGGSGYE